jgi:ribosomal protein S8E
MKRKKKKKKKRKKNGQKKKKKKKKKRGWEEGHGPVGSILALRPNSSAPGAARADLGREPGAAGRAPRGGGGCCCWW